ncbi:hypothetical protein ZIOFF_069861 [Zingiber officinale]|uniref:Uncharacterized protein n=1 Tax=Zingiber officinale TaxID=94328 RepID=A0A8J5EV86_ZINOF|nr:hypothetical protein ZIOFF_069861 [Zingiber officinale]
MSKKGKKHSLASPNEIQETIASHDLHGEEQINDDKTHKKKGRGPSKLKRVNDQDKCKELDRNELGQLIRDNSVKYVSFLRCMIKEFVPYTMDGWSEISEEVNDRMWSCLQIMHLLWLDNFSKSMPLNWHHNQVSTSPNGSNSFLNLAQSCPNLHNLHLLNILPFNSVITAILLSNGCEFHLFFFELSFTYKLESYHSVYANVHLLLLILALHSELLFSLRPLLNS